MKRRSLSQREERELMALTKKEQKIFYEDLKRMINELLEVAKGETPNFQKDFLSLRIIKTQETYEASFERSHKSTGFWIKNTFQKK